MPNPNSLCRYSDISGNRYGKLLALKKDTKSKHKGYWLFECECGNVKSISMYHVVKGEIVSCGCANRRGFAAIEKQKAKLIGKAFGQLRVLSFSHVDKGNSFWDCLCSCGRKTKIRASSLKLGYSKSCGCYRVLRRDKGESGLMRLYNIYRANAKKEWKDFFNIIGSVYRDHIQSLFILWDGSVASVNS